MVSNGGTPLITKWQFEVLSALKEARDHPEGPGYSHFDSSKGWFLASQLVDKKLLSGSNVRPGLVALCEVGFAETRYFESGRYFRITTRGANRLEDGYTDDANLMLIDSSKWTGIIEPVKISQVLAILFEMEDACEKITSNHDRAQIFGLIRALEVLLNIPEPPRQGVVSLIRDPAFSNIVQAATFLAAIIAAVKP